MADLHVRQLQLTMREVTPEPSRSARTSTISEFTQEDNGEETFLSIDESIASLEFGSSSSEDDVAGRQEGLRHPSNWIIERGEDSAPLISLIHRPETCSHQARLDDIGAVVLHNGLQTSSMTVYFAAVLMLFRYITHRRADIVYASSAGFVLIMPVAWLILFFRTQEHFTSANTHRPRIFAFSVITIACILCGTTEQRWVLSNDQAWLEHQSGMVSSIGIIIFEVFSLQFAMYALPFYKEDRTLGRRIGEGLLWGLTWIFMYLLVMSGLVVFAKVRVMVGSGDRSGQEKILLAMSGLFYKIFVDTALTLFSRMVFENLNILRLAHRELDMVLDKRGLTELPLDQEEKFCEIAAILFFSFDFCASLAAKLLLTALPDWRWVLGMSCIQGIQEVGVAYVTILLVVRDVEACEGDEAKAKKFKTRLALKMTKFVSDMSVEYLVMTTACVSAVIYQDCHNVTGFGSLTAGQAFKVWLAQVLPELVVDFVALTLVNRLHINVLPIYWRVQGEFLQRLVECAFSSMWLCFTVLLALNRSSSLDT